MAIAPFDSKTIDELQELGKLSGTEKLVASLENGDDTKKVSIDTIVGYAADLIAAAMGNSSTTFAIKPVSSGAGSIVFIEAGKTIDIKDRTLGCFYLEEQNQTSIRTRINIPTSVKVSKSLGLRRV